MFTHHCHGAFRALIVCLIFSACQPIAQPNRPVAPLPSINPALTIIPPANAGMMEMVGVQFAPLELTIQTDRLVANPYDSHQLDLRVHFHSPNGQAWVVPAFWLVEFDPVTQRPTEAAGWRVRFTPSQPGQWRAQAEIVGETGRSAAFEFTVQPSDNPGFVRIHPHNPRYFAFDDGSFYFPIGLNLGWSTGDVLTDYKRWFDQLQANGGNVARIWMAAWSFGLEWNESRLGDYSARQKQAWLLDQVFKLAEERGIYLMLTLLNHGAFSTTVNPEWADNPYNAANGGPLSTPANFVSDATARQFFQQRLRYIAARWGYSTHLFAWEWWNEVNWTGIGDQTLTPWIAAMTPVLAEFDPYDHLITNSNADGTLTKIWALPQIDFSQQHDYTGGDLVKTLREDLVDIRATAPNKPVLMGELGYAAGAEEGLDAMHLHIGLWAAPFLGYAGGSLYWWWDTFIDPQDQWHRYGSLARFFAGEDLSTLSASEAEVNSGAAQALILHNQQRALIWLRSDQFNVPAVRAAYDAAVRNALKTKTKLTDWQFEPPLRTGITITVNGLQAGDYRLRWYDPQTGEWVAEESLTVTGGATTVFAPAFAADFAAKISQE